MLNFALTSVNLVSVFFFFSFASIVRSLSIEGIAWNYISFAMRWRVDMLTVWAHYSLSEILSVHRPNHFSDAKCILYAIQCLALFSLSLLIATLWLSFHFNFLSCSLRFHHIKPQKNCLYISFYLVCFIFRELFWFQFQHISILVVKYNIKIICKVS